MCDDTSSIQFQSANARSIKGECSLFKRWKPLSILVSRTHMTLMGRGVSRGRIQQRLNTLKVSLAAGNIEFILGGDGCARVTNSTSLDTSPLPFTSKNGSYLHSVMHTDSKHHSAVRVQTGADHQDTILIDFDTVQEARRFVSALVDGGSDHSHFVPGPRGGRCVDHTRLTLIQSEALSPGKVPLVLSKCTTAIEASLQVEGLYRREGSTLARNYLVNQLAEKGVEADFSGDVYAVRSPSHHVTVGYSDIHRTFLFY